MSTIRGIIFVAITVALAIYLGALGVYLLATFGVMHAAEVETASLLGLPWTLVWRAMPVPLQGPVAALAVLGELAVLGTLWWLLARRRAAPAAAAVPRPSRLQNLARLWPFTAAATVVLLAVFLAWWFVDPAPPGRIRLASGPEGGYYERIARRYSWMLRQHGLTVEVIATHGTSENLTLLDMRKVDAAFVQGGVAPPEAGDTHLRTLASVALEPLWMFAAEPMDFVDWLERPSLTIAAGPPGSGTRAMLLRILNLLDLQERVELVPLAGAEAVAALERGEVDIAALVTAPTTPAVSTLLGEGEFHLVEASNADALLRRLPFAQRVVLPERVVDYAANRPPRDVTLLGAATALVVRDALHPAVKQVLLQVSGRVVSGDRLLGTYGAFPSRDFAEFPLDAEAQRYFDYGPTMVRRYLPYWAANLIERFWVLIIPIATLVIPIVRIGPGTVAWGIRRRIFRHYRDLKLLEAKAEEGNSPAERAAALKALERIDAQLKTIDVPLPYRDDLYRLRTHADFVRNRLHASGAAPADDPAATPATPTGGA